MNKKTTKKRKVSSKTKTRKKRRIVCKDSVTGQYVKYKKRVHRGRKKSIKHGARKRVKKVTRKR